MRSRSKPIRKPDTSADVNRIKAQAQDQSSVGWMGSASLMELMRAQDNGVVIILACLIHHSVEIDYLRP